MRAANRIDQDFGERARHGHRSRHDAGLQGIAGVRDCIVAICSYQAQWFKHGDHHDGAGAGRASEKSRNHEGGQSQFHARILSEPRVDWRAQILASLGTSPVGADEATQDACL